jgi:hypothetical protein
MCLPTCTSTARFFPRLITLRLLLFSLPCFVAGAGSAVDTPIAASGSRSQVVASDRINARGRSTVLVSTEIQTSLKNAGTGEGILCAVSRSLEFERLCFVLMQVCQCIIEFLGHVYIAGVSRCDSLSKTPVVLRPMHPWRPPNRRTAN